MAEQVVQKNSNIDWDYFIQEIGKIQRIQSTINYTANQVSFIEQDVNKVKEFVDFQESQKKQQIIQPKINSTLNVNEKKRYQNIGKQFVQGAGKEFEKVKKAIQFKDKMKTSPKDEFIKTVKKVKQGAKKTVKSGGFWKKLLGVIAILGLVALLFRDKIAKLLPDLSGVTDGIGEKIAKFFQDIVKGIVQYSTNIVSGTLTGVIQLVCNNLIPNILTTFFNTTLPASLVAATLAVMSVFSDSAGNELQSFLGRQAASHATSVADEADKQRQQIQNGISRSATNVWNLLAANQDAGTLLVMMSQFAGYMAQHGTDEQKEFFSQIDEAFDTATGQDQDWTTSQAQLLTTILNDISTLPENADGKLIDDIIRNRFTEAGIQLGDNVNFADVHSQLRSLSTSMRSHSKLSEWRGLFANKTQELNSGNGGAADVDNGNNVTPLINIRQINVGETLITAFVGQVQNVLSSLDNFLNGSQNENLFSGVNSFFTTLNDQVTKFFGESIRLLTQQLDKGFIFNIQPSNNSQSPNLPNFRFQGDSINVGDKSNIVYVQVFIDDAISRSMASLQEISKEQKNIVKTIQRGNNSLSTVVTKIKNLRIQDSQGILAKLAENTESVNDARQLSLANQAEIGRHNTRLQKLQNPQPQSSEANDSPNTTFS